MKTKMTQAEILEKDQKYILRPWAGANEPLPIVEAKNSHVTDASGRSFLDFTSGYFVNNAGHTRREIIDAVNEQLQHVFQVSGRHTTIPLVLLAERLVKLTPTSVNKVFFTTGGSESTEFALKLARQHTKKTHIACLENGFHGLSLGALAACGAEKYRNTAGVPMGDFVYQIPRPYYYRSGDLSREAYEDQLLETIDKILGEKAAVTAALMGEPVQSVGGMCPSKRWWQKVDEIRKRHGILLILDEIQTGCGRTGKMFACEHFGLQPDILTSAKGLSGGVGSLGAVVVNSEIGEGFYAGTTPTSGGNAISASAGLALLNVLEEDKIVEHCAAMGEYFTAKVANLGDPWVGDIRLTGLLGGVELVQDQKTKEPLPKAKMLEIQNTLFASGNLLTASGPHGNVLRLQPPLVITKEEIDGFVVKLKAALEAARS